MRLDSKAGPREKEPESDALNKLRTLHDQVRARNASLGTDEANALADRMSREIADDLAESGAVTFERDTGSGN